jgi:hypothetical protein
MIAVRVGEPDLAFELALPFEIEGVVNGDVNSPAFDVQVERTTR